MLFQRSANGDLVVTIEGPAESVELYDAVEEFEERVKFNGEESLPFMVELKDELAKVNAEYAAADEQPTLFETETPADGTTLAVGRASVKIDNRLPASPLDDPSSWMAQNVEYQLGKEAGWRGDELVGEKSERYMVGYGDGQVGRSQFDLKMNGQKK